MATKNIIDTQPSWYHQRAVRNLLFHLLYDLDLSRFEPLPFARLDYNDHSSAVGDIIIADVRKQKAVVVIEVVNKRNYIQEAKKLRLALEEYTYLEEAFLIDYETEDWTKMNRASLADSDEDFELQLMEKSDSKLEDDWEEDEYDFESMRDLPSYSSILKMDLSDYIRLDYLS